MSHSLRSLCAIYMAARSGDEERAALVATHSDGPLGSTRDPLWLLLAKQALVEGAHAEHVLNGREELLADLPNLVSSLLIAVDQSITAEDARDEANPLTEIWSTPGGVRLVPDPEEDA